MGVEIFGSNDRRGPNERRHVLAIKLLMPVVDRHLPVWMKMNLQARSSAEVESAIGIDESEGPVVDLEHEVLGHDAFFAPAKDMVEVQPTDVPVSVIS